jgi:hypothetical protein
MAKSGAILGIIGILLGAGGLTFGVLSWFSVEQVPIKNTWYDYIESDGLGTTGEVIDGLSISMTLDAGQMLYVSFTGTLRCDGMLDEFYIQIDGISTTGYDKVTRASVAGWEYFPLSIQYYNASVVAGAHVITVFVDNDDSGSAVYDCALFVQTLTA